MRGEIRPTMQLLPNPFSPPLCSYVLPDAHAQGLGGLCVGEGQVGAGGKGEAIHRKSSMSQIIENTQKRTIEGVFLFGKHGRGRMFPWWGHNKGGNALPSQGTQHHWMSWQQMLLPLHATRHWSLYSKCHSSFNSMVLGPLFGCRWEALFEPALTSR